MDRKIYTGLISRRPHISGNGVPPPQTISDFKRHVAIEQPIEAPSWYDSAPVSPRPRASRINEHNPTGDVAFDDAASCRHDVSNDDAASLRDDDDDDEWLSLANERSTFGGIRDVAGDVRRRRKAASPVSASSNEAAGSLRARREKASCPTDDRRQLDAACEAIVEDARKRIEQLAQEMSARQRDVL